MRAKRFEREDAEAEKSKVEAAEKTERERVEGETRWKAEELVKIHKVKMLGRLEELNRVLELLGVQK